MAWSSELRKNKIHEQSGSFRLTVPMEWARRNGVRNKDALRTIEYDGMIVVLGRDLEVEEEAHVLDDLKTKFQILRLLEKR